MVIDKNDPVVLAIHRTITTAPEFAHMGTDEAITRFFLRNLVVTDSDRKVARLTRAQHHLTWAAAILAVVIVNWTTWGRYQTPLLPDRFWAIGVVVLAPLMGMASVLAAMRLSAKMTDPQSANQFTG
jgi:hypothetical protein